MTPAKIRVTILGDSSAPPCEGDCAINWLDPEHRALATKELARRFGSDVGVEFVDVSGPPQKAEQRAFILRARREGLTFPALLINGNTRIPGPFDMRMLLDIVEVEVERKL